MQRRNSTIYSNQYRSGFEDRISVTLTQKIISAFGLKNLTHYSSFLLIFLVVIIGCDATGEPPSTTPNAPEISNFEVSPSLVSFDKETDGYKDTTLTFTISVTPEDISEPVSFNFIVIDQLKNTLVKSGSLATNGESYTTNFFIETKTTSVMNLIVEVNAFNANGNSTFAQSYIEINGFQNAVPVIVFAENPSKVSLPEQGSKVVSFKAKVTDLDGQDTIDGVFLRLISTASGEVSGSPFTLQDNGTQEDEVAADSIFTASFTINANNDPQSYNILYYAKDIGGLVSDTTKTTFRISSN